MRTLRVAAVSCKCFSANLHVFLETGNSNSKNFYFIPELKLVFTSDDQSRSRKSAYDLVNIENRSRKRSHKLHVIEGVRRIRRFPFLPIPFTTPSLMNH